MLILASLMACGSSDDAPADSDATTYFRDAKPIIDTKCATCHQPGNVGPFPMTTAEEVAAVASISKMAVESGQMPPFLPSHDCNTYTTDFDLTDSERETLLAFFEEGAPAGEPEGAAESSIPSQELDADVVMRLPEAYTPVVEPDDYRCQMIDPQITEPTYVTGFEVRPDERSIVHHTIVFIVSENQRATYEGYDAAEAGPGWTCFGGPNPESAASDIDLSDLTELLNDPTAIADRVGLRTLGSWVPGAQQGLLPPGTGILLNPGDQLVVQMHYNTLSASPVADQSEVAMKVADSVEYVATTLPLLDLAWPTGLALLGEPMDIPAGSTDATASVVMDSTDFLVQSARNTLGVADDEPIRIHGAGVHMHQLGVDGRIDLIKPDGSEQCVIHYPDWDFNWQGTHFLTQTIELAPDDALRLSCLWDNSAENQPVIDGEVADPRDVTWGEGTRDEMCLGNLFVTR